MNHIVQFPSNSIMISGSSKSSAKIDLISSHIEMLKGGSLVIVDTFVGHLELGVRSALIYFNQHNERNINIKDYGNVFFLIDSINIGENLVLSYKEPSTLVKNIISKLIDSKQLINCYYTTYYSNTTKNK